MVNFFKKKEVPLESEAQETAAEQQEEAALENTQSFGQAIIPVIACGAGLFSDGYINNVSLPLPAHGEHPKHTIA